MTASARRSDSCSACGVMLIHSEALISSDEVKLSFGALILVPPPTPAQYLICQRCRSRVPVTFNYCSFCGYMLHPERVWAYASKSAKNARRDYRCRLASVQNADKNSNSGDTTISYSENTAL